MRKLMVLILFLVASASASAQMVWDVTPKTFTDEVGQQHTVTGMEVKLVSAIEIDTLATHELTLFIAFQLDDGSSYGGRNVKSSAFVTKMVSQGMDEGTATATVHQILGGLFFSDVATKRVLAAQLVGLYGYVLVE